MAARAASGEPADRRRDLELRFEKIADQDGLGLRR
jgi:hypothetical protein